MCMLITSWKEYNMKETQITSPSPPSIIATKEAMPWSSNTRSNFKDFSTLWSTCLAKTIRVTISHVIHNHWTRWHGGGQQWWTVHWQSHHAWHTRCCDTSHAAAGFQRGPNDAEGCDAHSEGTHLEWPLPKGLPSDILWTHVCRWAHNRLIIPDEELLAGSGSLQPLVVHITHEVHQGITKCKWLLRSNIWTWLKTRSRVVWPVRPPPTSRPET